MIFVRLAMGTGVSGPEVTSTPTAGTATAACPVVGHGNTTGDDAARTVGATMPVTAATGVGAWSRTTATAASTSTRTRTTTKDRTITRRRRVRRRRTWRAGGTAGTPSGIF